MTNLTTLSPRTNLHSLKACTFCGARERVYLTYLLTTRSVAAVCEDPVACLRRKGRRRDV